jgi:putative endonuclease
MADTRSTHERGAHQERRAQALLRARGMQIVEQNYRCRFGEIDIVARDGDELIFVEVRSRRHGDRGLAEETINHVKRERLIRVAEFYLSHRQPRFSTCRFDVVAITGDRVELFIDAFRS